MVFGILAGRQNGSRAVWQNDKRVMGSVQAIIRKPKHTLIPFHGGSFQASPVSLFMSEPIGIVSHGQ